MKRWRLFAVFAIALGLAAVGCGDDDDDDASASDDDADDDADDDMGFDDPIDEGRYWLQAGEWDRARAAFAVALDEDDKNPDARYGAMMAAGHHLVATFALIYNYIAGIDGFVQPEKDAPDPDEEFLQYILDTALSVLMGGAPEEVIENADWVEDHGDAPFPVDDVPVVMAYETVALLGPEFDGGERHGYQAFAGLFGGLYHLLAPLNADMNLSYVFTIGDGGLYGVVDNLCRILTDPAFPDTFTIDEDRWEEFGLSQFDLGRAFRSAGNAFDAVRMETDYQGDDVLAYRDANSDFSFDEGEPFIVPGIGELDEDGMEAAAGFEALFLAAGDAFLDRTDEDANPDADDPLSLADFNVLMTVLDLPEILPAGVTIDIAALYENSDPDGLRELITDVTLLLAGLLTDAPECVEDLS